MKVPSGVRVAGNADVSLKAPNLWYLENEGEVFDIVFFASLNLETRSYKFGSSELLLSHMGTSPEIVRHLSDDIGAIHLLYSKNFGPLSSQKSNYHFIMTTRKNGPSYSRGNFAVMTKMDMSEYRSLFKVTAHEIGHFWWNKADINSWQDWLNEAFSDYSSFMALRAKYGEKYVTALWQKAQESFYTLPPIMGISRTHKKAQEVLYQKGAYLLHQLRQKTPDKQFFDLIKSTYRSKVVTTDQFIGQIALFYSEEDVAWFRNTLAAGKNSE